MPHVKTTTGNSPYYGLHKPSSTDKAGRGGPRPGSAWRTQPWQKKKKRERESASHFGSSRPAAVLLVRGALGDGPPGGAESGLCFSGGWTFSRVGGGLSHYVAMFLLASAQGPSR